MIPIAKPWLDDDELEALRAPIESGWVAQGPEVAAFEQELARFVGAPHACAVSSGTTALFLALRALGVGPGDEVVTVSHSFIASANAVRHLGAVPVFVDIEPDTFNMDSRLVEAVLTERTGAILCVHQMGMPCDVGKLVQIAREHELPLVEDAACAIGSEIQVDDGWEPIGRPHGDVACFSFHPRKILTTGEGGMITTADAELDAKCRSWRQHSQPDYADLGFNFRMSDLQAALGRVQLRRLGEVVVRRRQLASRYTELLAPIDGLVAPVEPAWALTNWQSYCVRLPVGADQAKVIAAMAEAGVATLGGIMCAHREPLYTTEPWQCGRDHSECGCEPGHCEALSESERAQDRCLILPLFHEMTRSDQEKVVTTLERILSW